MNKNIFSHRPMRTRSLKRAIVTLCVFSAFLFAQNCYSIYDRSNIHAVQEQGLKLRAARGNIQRAVLHSLQAKGQLTDEDLKTIQQNFEAAHYEESFEK